MIWNTALYSDFNHTKKDALKSRRINKIMQFKIMEFLAVESNPSRSPIKTTYDKVGEVVLDQKETYDEAVDKLIEIESKIDPALKMEEIGIGTGIMVPKKNKVLTGRYILQTVSKLDHFLYKLTKRLTGYPRLGGRPILYQLSYYNPQLQHFRIFSENEFCEPMMLEIENVESIDYLFE